MSALLGWLTFGVLAATLIVIAWYTVETFKLRREAQLNTELQNRPFLIVECPGAGLNGQVLIRNVGRGIAVNVSMVRVEMGEDVRVEHLGLMHLRPDEVGAPRLRVVSLKLGPVPPIGSTTTQQNAVQLLTTKNPVLHLDYESNVASTISHLLCARWDHRSVTGRQQAMIAAIYARKSTERRGWV